MGPDPIGDGNYLPHGTVGIARFGDLKISEVEPPCAASSGEPSP